ncbi:MAG: DUF983 domain-containing protein [Pirellulales bacterium]
MKDYPRQKFLPQVERALRLRCPRCGIGRLFTGWFRMSPTCSECGLKYEREPGFFLGAIYFNYGLTALISAFAYPILLFSGTLHRQQTFAVTIAFVILFPLWFFRYARSLWLGFDYFWDRTPRP